LLIHLGLINHVPIKKRSSSFGCGLEMFIRLNIREYLNGTLNILFGLPEK